MFIYIAHAEADQAAADELKKFLSSRGLVVHTETGARGFAHLQASDVVIGLWSRDSTFASHRMQIERRMFDAWADERLVLVRLGHAIMPVGLRDLPFIDGSFESGRDLAVWPKVERAAKDAMNRALVAGQASGHSAGPGGGGFGGGLHDDLAMPGDGKVQRPSQATRTSAVPPTPPAAAKRGSPLGVLVFLAALAVVGWTVWTVYQANWVVTNVSRSMLALGGICFLAVVFMLFRPRGGSKAKAAKAPAPSRKRAEATAAAAPPPPQPAAAAAAAPASVFISYAHADNAQVEPVVKVVQDNGRTVWIDKTGIEAGEGWAGEIVRAIKSAKGVLVMCSKQAFESDHVKREVYLADRYKKPMAPVFLEQAQPPEDFEYFFASVQWLELWKLPEADRPAAIGKALEAV